jgi:hypothetical protein
MGLGRGLLFRIRRSMRSYEDDAALVRYLRGFRDGSTGEGGICEIRDCGTEVKGMCTKMGREEHAFIENQRRICAAGESCETLDVLE